MASRRRSRNKAVEVKDKNHDDDEYEKGNEFTDRTYDVEGGRLPRTPQNDEIEGPYQQGTADDGPYGVAACKIGREKIVEGVHGDDGIAHVAENLAEPVGPGDKKSGEGAEAHFSVHIDARREIGSGVGEDTEGVCQKRTCPGL